MNCVLLKYRKTLKRIGKWPGSRAYKDKMIYNLSVVYRFDNNNKEKMEELERLWDLAFEDIDSLATKHPPSFNTHQKQKNPEL